MARCRCAGWSVTNSCCICCTRRSRPSRCSLPIPVCGVRFGTPRLCSLGGARRHHRRSAGHNAGQGNRGCAPGVHEASGAMLTNAGRSASSARASLATRAPARILDRTTLQVASMYVVAGQVVIAFLARHGRTRTSRSICRASRGRCSLILMLGTAVAISRKGPPWHDRA